MQNLNIEKAENGWVLSHAEETEEGKYEVVKELVIDEMDNQGMTNLLMAVNDYFGKSYDKFGKENLNITWDGVGSKIE